MKKNSGALLKTSLVGLFLVVTAAAAAIRAKPLENMTSYNYETEAQNVLIYRPQNVEEVQALIRIANQNHTKVRFSGASHSTSSVILGPGAYLKSENFNHILGVEFDTENGAVVEVESGVKLGDLASYLEERGYSLGFAYPYYAEVSIGGLLSTGSHGSSRIHTALSSQNIVEMQMINGLGDLVKINSRTPEMLKAARVHLGLLGFVYKVKFKIVPDFKVEFKSESLVDENALLQKDGTIKWGSVADTEYIYWYPKYNRAVKVSGQITDKDEFPGAQSVVLGDKNDGGLQDQIQYQVLALGQNNTIVNEWLEDYRFKNSMGAPPPYVYVDHGQEVQAQGIVGRSAKMLISKRIRLNPVYTQKDISFAFKIDDAPKVMRLIHEFCVENNYYHPFIGIFFRFAQSDGQSYLSHIEGGGSQKSLYVMAEFFEVKKYEHGDAPTLSSVMRNNMLALLASQNLITFHWGKNTDEIFALGANRNILDKNILEFEQVRKSMDPNDIFSNAFTDEILFGKVAP